MLLKEFWTNRYRSSLEGLREVTITGYESAWRTHIVKLGDCELTDLDVERIETWLASIPTRGGAAKAWGVLRAMLRKAVRWGLLDVDVTMLVTPPRKPDYRPDVLDASQGKALLQGFFGHELEAWLICSVTLGLRTEEAHGLELGDINLVTGEARIVRCVQWVNGRELTVPPKTPLSRRAVVLPRFAVNRLRQIKRKGRLVGTLTPPQVDRKYRSWCRKQNLPLVPRRNLRHSWATTALAAGVDVTVVSRALGHTSIQTTARYYLRPDLSVLKDAQKVWEKVLLNA